MYLSGFRVVLALLAASFGFVALAQEANTDLWGDPVPEQRPAITAPVDANPNFQQSGTSVPAAVSPEPPLDPGIQMWQIIEPQDMLRMRPNPSVFADFRKGAIDFWVRYDSQWVSDGDRGTVVALSNGYDTLFEISVAANGQGIIVANGQDDGFGSSAVKENFVNASLVDGLIHHVAIVTDDDTSEVYLDGRHAGTASVGYVISEDAQGAKKNLQLSIGSLDGRKNTFQGQVGAVRIWGAPLPAEALFKAAFLRDQNLLSLPWVSSLLIGHLDNQQGATNKPNMNFLSPMFRPTGIWMTSDNAKRRKTQPKGEGLDYRFNAQTYVQLILAQRDSVLARYAYGYRGADLTKKSVSQLSTATQQLNSAAPANSLLAVARPRGPVLETDLPVLLSLKFAPQAGRARSQIAISVYTPTGRNRYRSATGQQMQLDSRLRISTGSEQLQRQDNYDRPATKDDTRVDDVFIVSNQIRGKATILNGWNPIFLDPFDYNEPLGGVDVQGRPQSGQKGRIFAHSDYGFNNEANRVVPLGLNLIDVQSGEGRKKHTEITTERKLMNEIGGNISVEGSVDAMVAGGSFTANVRFKSTTETLRTGQDAFTLAQSFNTRFVMLLDKAKIGLDENFRDAVRAAANNPSAESADRIVQEFGTHYAQSIAMGGRVTEMVELNAETWGEAMTYAGGVGGSVEARVGKPGKGPGGSLKVGGEIAGATSDSFNQALTNSVENWATSGGTGGANTMNWSVTDETTAPIYLDLRPISEILAPPFFLEPAVFETLRPMVRLAMEKFVVANARNTNTNELFVPKAFVQPKIDLGPLGCVTDRISYRHYLNSDDDFDDDGVDNKDDTSFDRRTIQSNDVDRSMKHRHGGVWVQFALPTATHGAVKRYENGCYNSWFYEGRRIKRECNNLCWQRAIFRCENGEWKTSTLSFNPKRVGCVTGYSNISQEGLVVGKGVAPWVPVYGDTNPDINRLTCENSPRNAAAEREQGKTPGRPDFCSRYDN